MGSFGYICKGCGTQIVGGCYDGGENCVLIHVRDGKEVGRVSGHYNEYGGVIEQKDWDEKDKFRGDNDSINGHDEIWKSEFRMPNSYHKVSEQRVFENEYLSEVIKNPNVNFETYVRRYIALLSKDYRFKWHESPLFELLDTDDKNEFLGRLKTETQDEQRLTNEEIRMSLEELWTKHDTFLYEDFMKLPQVKLDNYSGIAAWHKKCYCVASDTDKSDLTPSKEDENQSWGEVREEYK